MIDRAQIFVTVNIACTLLIILTFDMLTMHKIADKYPSLMFIIEFIKVFMTKLTHL